MIWPCAYANAQSLVAEISNKNIKLQSQVSSKIQRCSLLRKKLSLQPQCKVGVTVQANQIVASVVPIDLSPVRQDSVDEDFFISQLQSASLSERYAAAKALRFRGYKKAGVHLKRRMLDKAEDIYIQLEAAASLAAHADTSGWEFMSDCLNSEYLTVQLETVIVLSEISDPRSEQLLISVLVDPNRNSEVRAGAAWALGEFATKNSASALIDAFNLTSTEIKIEAARALLKITPSQIEQVVETIKSIDPSKRDGIAWALAKTGGFDPSDLLRNHQDDNLRRWTSYILGYGKPLFLETQIEELAKLDPEVHFAASVLWQLLASWIYELKEY
jgi:HEAT repeat protein